MLQIDKDKNTALNGRGKNKGNIAGLLVVKKMKEVSQQKNLNKWTERWKEHFKGNRKKYPK